MSDIVLKDITSGYNYSRITYNFQVVQDVVNNQLLHLVGGNNTMLQDLDMNGNQILNIGVDTDNTNSLLTVGAADDRYLKLDGSSTMEGVLRMGGNKVVSVGAPTSPTDAARKMEVDKEASYRAEADESLQKQISSGVPLASPFSVISWHDQEIGNSVTIPPNKNAWSFGPVITISPGQVVTIGSGSFWTIANGETQE